MTGDTDPARTLLADILAIINRHQGRNAEQAMTEIEAACMASIDADLADLDVVRRLLGETP